MAREIVKKFEDDATINTVLNSDQYSIFEINECTLPELEKKCEFILSRHTVEYKPLKLEKVVPINMYIMTYYTKKY